MPKLKHKESGEEFTTSEMPHWSPSTRCWECGDLRFADFEGDLYEAISDPPAPLTIGTRKPTPPQFLTLFTPQERIAARASEDAFVQDFMALLSDPRMSEVDLDGPPVIQAVNYLAFATIIQGYRIAPILAGEFPS